MHTPAMFLRASRGRFASGRCMLTSAASGLPSRGERPPRPRLRRSGLPASLVPAQSEAVAA